jgi:hypothetical protein
MLCLPFCTFALFVLLYFFLLAIVLSVLLRYTDFNYPFGIFKLFFDLIVSNNCVRNVENLPYYLHSLLKQYDIFHNLILTIWQFYLNSMKPSLYLV